MKLKILLLILSLISFSTPSFASICLQKSLRNATEGTYSVFSYGGSQMLLVIKKQTKEYVLVEKIRYSVPFKPPCDWQKIVLSRKGCPKVNVIKISKDGIDSFLWDQKLNALNKVVSSSLLIDILKLNFDNIPEERLRKTGGVSGSIWHPRIMSNCEEFKTDTTIALESFWPEDNSSLAKKRIEIRLPSSNLSVFPVWIEIDNRIRIKCIEIGTNLETPYHYEIIDAT